MGFKLRLTAVLHTAKVQINSTTHPQAYCTDIFILFIQQICECLMYVTQDRRGRDINGEQSGDGPV